MTLHQTPDGPIETREWSHPGTNDDNAEELLLLLHAAASAPGAFDALARALAVPGRIVVAPALNGYGKSAIQASGDAIEQHVVLAQSVYDHYQLERNAIFGHSMGGLCALELAARVQCERLALYEPIVLGCLDLEDPQQRAGLQWDRDAVDALRHHVRAGQPEEGLAAFIHAWNEVEWGAVPASVRATLLASADRLTEETTVVSYREAPHAALAALAMPVLLLHGSRSPGVAKQVVQELSKRLTNARVRTIADAGHMAPALAPTRLEGPLLAWFGQ